ncbi:uncharacterized protein LOC135099807 isoform X1 [Scylla paramamosain]|uniref:uncharacterized protein LOC135099807 isoform X1 n=1 Tax=Scylla paramamosain TaxID=85552 RepID=UPI003083A659
MKVSPARHHTTYCTMKKSAYEATASGSSCAVSRHSSSGSCSPAGGSPAPKEELNVSLQQLREEYCRSVQDGLSRSHTPSKQPLDTGVSIRQLTRSMNDLRGVGRDSPCSIIECDRPALASVNVKALTRSFSDLTRLNSEPLGPTTPTTPRHLSPTHSVNVKKLRASYGDLHRLTSGESGGLWEYGGVSPSLPHSHAMKPGNSTYKACSKLPLPTESRIPILKPSPHKSTTQIPKLSKKEPESSPPKPLLAPKPTSTLPCPSSSLPQHATASRPGKFVLSNTSKSAAKTDTSTKKPKILSVQPSQGTSGVQDKKTAHKTATKQNLAKADSTDGEAVIAEYQRGDSPTMVDLGGRRSKPPAPNNNKTNINNNNTNNNNDAAPSPPRASVYTGVSVKHLRRSYCDQARLCEALDEAGRAGSGRKPYITKANVARICASLVGPIPPPPRTPPRRHISTGVSVNLMVSGPLLHPRCLHLFPHLRLHTHSSHPLTLHFGPFPASDTPLETRLLVVLICYCCCCCSAVHVS